MILGVTEAQDMAALAATSGRTCLSSRNFQLKSVRVRCPAPKCLPTGVHGAEGLSVCQDSWGLVRGVSGRPEVGAVQEGGSAVRGVGATPLRTWQLTFSHTHIPHGGPTSQAPCVTAGLYACTVSACGGGPSQISGTVHPRGWDGYKSHPALTPADQ